MSFSLPQSFKSSPQEKLVGLFIIFALSAFIYLGTLKGGLSNKTSNIEFITNVSQSFGITLGAPVKLAGVNIGKVSKIELLTSGRVAISINLPTKYQSLYKTDSSLKIDSQLGFDTMLIGQGMIFSPGTRESLLKNGDFLKTHEPQSLSDLTKGFNIIESSKKITHIIKNLDKLTTYVASKDKDIDAIFNNLMTLTSSLINTNNQIASGIHNLNSSLTSFDNKLNPILTLVENRLIDSEQTINASTNLLNELTLLSKQTKPSINKVPKTLEQLNNALFEVELLTKQLRGLWILGANQVTQTKNTDEIAIPYYNNKESLKDLLNKPIKGDVGEQIKN